MNQIYTYHVLEGDAKSIGRQEALFLKENKPESIPFWSTPFEGRKDRLKEADQFFEMNERWCPGLNEEILGFSEELGIKPEATLYYTVTIPRTGNCSQFVVLPDRSKSGTTLCARSYEWSKDDDLTLKTVRIPGKAAHTGFSVAGFGRSDGINDRGLWVSMTLAKPTPGIALPDNKGFRFWALVRTILERCSSVAEAIELSSEFPLAFHLSMLVAEKKGKAALIEKSPERMEVLRGESGFMHATNHYTLPDMRSYNDFIFTHSQTRWDFLAKRLRHEKQSPETIRAILSGSFPEGLACHYYREYFGTLWSMYADLSEGTVNACFGPADIRENSFRTFSPRDPAGITKYEAELPDEFAGERMWTRIPRPENV